MNSLLYTLNVIPDLYNTFLVQLEDFLLPSKKSSTPLPSYKKNYKYKRNMAGNGQAAPI